MYINYKYSKLNFLYKIVTFFIKTVFIIIFYVELGTYNIVFTSNIIQQPDNRQQFKQNPKITLKTAQRRAIKHSHGDNGAPHHPPAPLTVGGE